MIDFLNRPKSAKNLKKCCACGARKRENKRKLFKIGIKPQKNSRLQRWPPAVGGAAPQPRISRGGLGASPKPPLLICLDCIGDKLTALRGRRIPSLRH